MGRNIKLSQCMIVKNEEKNIEKALSWGRGIVCEQIVVDTGSTDRTVEIAERMGAKVYHYQWQDDFSAAKNYAMEQASGDWIAFLDADEYFLEHDAQKILPLLDKVESTAGTKQYQVIKCTLLNINENGHVFSSMQQTRLMKRGAVCYQNKIHEALCPKSTPDIHCLNVEDELVIYHTGYSPHVYRTTNKLERNISIIQKVLEEQPENYNYWSYLGDVLFAADRYQEAREAYGKVLLHLDSKIEASRLDMAFTNLMLITVRTPSEHTDEDMAELFRLFEESGSDCPDVDYWAGIHYISQGQKEEGVRHLERTLRNLETYQRGASLASAGNIKTIYGCLEHLYADLQEPSLAVKYGVLTLRMDRYQVFELKVLLHVMQQEPAQAVAGFLRKLYDFSQIKDKLFLMKAAKETGFHALEEELYRLLSPEEQRWLDRKAESPYMLPAAEQAARYPSVTCRNKTDTRFLELLEEIRQETPERLAWQMKGNLEEFKNQQGNYESFLEIFRAYGCWGRLVPEAGNYESFEKRSASLKENWASLLWLYENLADYRSKRAMTAILDNWMHMEFHLLDQAKENGPCFFDTDLIPDARDMVYMDISMSDFQSVWDFIQTYGEAYQQIYCYAGEVPEGSQLARRITAYKNVTILDEMPHGVSAEPDGPLFIKLDIGAGLMDVLDSCRELVTHNHPVLAICADNGYEDVWMAAQQIHGMDPSYRFYLRYYGGNLIPTRYVLFAL